MKGQVWKITARKDQKVLPEKFWVEFLKKDIENEPTKEEIIHAINKKYDFLQKEDEIYKAIILEKL